MDARRDLVGATHARADLEAQVDHSRPLPDSAHVNVMRAAGDLPEIIRRGFPYRGDGKEGLVFLAAASDPERFTGLLQKMADAPDGVLEFASVQEQRLLYVPPRNFAQIHNVDVPELPTAARALRTQNGAGEDLELEDYTVASAFRAFIDQSRDTLFPDSLMSEDVYTLVGALAAVGAGGSLNTAPTVTGANETQRQALMALMDEAQATAKAFNDLAGRYMTVS